MPTSIVPPDLRRILTDLARRVAILERRVRPDDTGGDNELIFTLPGTVIVSESPPATLRHGGYVTAMRCLLGAAGSTATTVTLDQDGTTVATATLGSGVTVVEIGVRVRFGADTERITIAVTGAGTGAEDLTVQVRY